MNGETGPKPLDNIAAQFKQDGYAIDRSVFRGDELRALQDETSTMITADRRKPAEDYQIRDGKPWKIDFPSDPSKRELNNSIGIAAVHPRIMQVMQRIIGPRVTLINTILTFKHNAGGAVVPRHRDDFPDRVQFSQAHVVMSADIYLDEATTANGCLYVKPGSQLIGDVRADVARTMDETDDMVPVQMQAGDVLYHDALIVHGSKATPPSDNQRRVLYAVFAAPDMLVEEGLLATVPPPNREWVAGVLAQTSYWRGQRLDAYPSSNDGWSIPQSWENEVSSAKPLLRADPTWLIEASRDDLRERFAEMSKNEFTDEYR